MIIKKINIIFPLFVMALLIASCDKDEKIYSCNKDVNDWVTANKSQIDTIAYRESLLNFELEYQKGIYRALKPKIRYLIWVDKINQVLKLNWENDERKHIEELLNSINEKWFSEKLLSDKELISQRKGVLKNWVSLGLKELGWSKALIHSIAIRLDVKKSDDNYLIETYISDYKKTSNLKEAGGGCKCSSGDDWCDLGGGNDNGSCTEDLYDCNHSSWGCGLLWLSECDGLCELGVPDDN
jgi:hypothetical protein